MDSIAGPSRRRASLHIDLDTNPIDQVRYASPISTYSTAPSWRPERASTQSGFSTETWGGPQTPRTERSDRLSYPSIHGGFGIGISEDKDDTVTYGRLEVEGGEQTPGPGLGLDVGTGKPGWWIDMDKTPRPSDMISQAPSYPSRQPSLRTRPPLSLSIPSTPLSIPSRQDECALPDDSPTIPACIQLPQIPSADLDIPTFKSCIRPRIPVRPPRPDTVLTQDFLALFPVPDLSTLVVEPQAIPITTGPPPSIPTRGSSRSKSRQPSPAAAVPTPLSAPVIIPVQGPPPAILPRASSLRSPSSRASSSSSTSSLQSPAPVQKEMIAPANNIMVPPSLSPGSLSRQPRVRSRTAPAPVVRPRTRTASEQLPTFNSRASLASIVEDETPNDLESDPNGDWSLRERRQGDLQRAMSQPHARRGNDDSTLSRRISAMSGGMV